MEDLIRTKTLPERLASDLQRHVLDRKNVLISGGTGTGKTTLLNILTNFTCVLQSGIELPYHAIKSNIADSLNLLVQLERRPGQRFVSEVLEIRGYDPAADRYDLAALYTRQEDVCQHKN